MTGRQITLYSDEETVTCDVYAAALEALDFLCIYSIF